VISPAEKQKFVEYFKAADSDGDGFVTGIEAKVLFSKSGLEVADLAKIWKLSDINQDTKLDLEEFSIAMFLINSRRKGLPVPDFLPSTLLPTNSVTSPKSLELRISPEEKAKYREIFLRADPSGGFVNGEAAKKTVW
jgi:epidermal growth factor receptor substrate 15